MNIRSILKTFKSETRGSLSVEAIMVLPLLLWGATATYTYFDVYKAQNTTYRANYTISDMLSRETTAINAAYANGLFKVFKYMTGATDANSWARISVLNCLSDCADDTIRTMTFDWSHGINGAVDLVDTDIPYIEDVVPIFSSGDRLILVQTSTDWEPPFSANLTKFVGRTIKTDIVTRPRFAPQLLWEGPGPGGTDGTDTPIDPAES